MKDRLWGYRKAIRVNRITVTAFGWQRLFKTHLRMGNFLSGSILGTPTFGSSRAQGPFSQGEGGELFLLFLLLSVERGFFANACVALFFSYIINNPPRFPQSDSRQEKRAVFFLCVCVCACLSEHFAHRGNNQLHCVCDWSGESSLLSIWRKETK